MRGTMFRQSATLSKAKSTRVTFEGFLSHMSAQVPFQSATVSKAPAAQVAFEGILFSMSAQMIKQTASLSIAHYARVTFDGLLYIIINEFANVCSNCYLQQSMIRISHMLLQTATLGEA